MSSHPTNFVGSIPDAVRAAIVGKLPDAQVEVEGSGGHFRIDVLSQAFAGKSLLQQQRLVLTAIAHLMAGDQAPVHAVDVLKTRTA